MKKYFIPIRLSLPLNWKLANLLAKASSAHTLWVPQHWRSRYFSYPGKWRYFGLQNATEQLSQEWTGPLPPTLCPDLMSLSITSQLLSKMNISAVKSFWNVGIICFIYLCVLTWRNVFQIYYRSYSLEWEGIIGLCRLNWLSPAHLVKYYCPNVLSFEACCVVYSKSLF